MKRLRTLTVASTLLTAALVLVGCSQPSGTPVTDHDHGEMMSTAAPGDVNAADEMFVTMMIPHHEQAIEMADIILAKDNTDQRWRIV